MWLQFVIWLTVLELVKEFWSDCDLGTALQCDLQCITKDDPATGRRVVAGVHWDYDCYGGLLKRKLGLPTMMPTWDKDYATGRALLEMNGHQVFEAPIHLEGGSIHSDVQEYHPNSFPPRFPLKLALEMNSACK